MKLHELKYTEGSRKTRNRVGRGQASGNGKTAGRGPVSYTHLTLPTNREV